MDVDIRNNLGRLPPDLDTIYAELYDILSEKPGEMEKKLFKNVLSWLLCAQVTLQTSAFLKAVSIPTEGNDSRIRVTKELVLKICGSLVVFDAELNTFRFAHLSVREFLERRQEYTTMATNALIADISLRRLMSANIPSEVEGLLSEHGLFSNHDLPDRDRSIQYSYMYWSLHSQLAGHRRISGDLKETFQRFILSADTPSSPIRSWLDTLPDVLDGRIYCTENEVKLRAIMTTSGSTVSRILFLACIFDFFEVLEVLKDEWTKSGHFLNAQNRNLFDVSVSYGSFGSLKVLLDAASNMDVSKILVRTAAACDNQSGEQIMRILLDKRGTEIQRIPEVVLAAASMSGCENFIELLLNKHGSEIQITPEIVQAAAGNRQSGKEIMRILLDERGREIQITPDVVLAAAKNWNYGEQIMRLLLEKHGSEIQNSLPEVVQEAAENPISGEQIISLLFDKHTSKMEITQEVVQAVASTRESINIIEILFDKRGSEIQLTPEIIEAVAGNWHSGEKIMKFLLDERGTEIQITPDVVLAAANNWLRGEQIMTLLLDKRGSEIQITPEIVQTAARKWREGGKGLELLLAKQGAEIPITAEMAQTVPWD